MDADGQFAPGDTISAGERAGASSCPFSGADGQLREGVSLADADVNPDRFGFYTALREQQPVFFDPKLQMYLVSRYDDVQTVMRDPGSFSLELAYAETIANGFQEEFKAILERDGGGFFRDGITSDPPAHSRLRRLYDKAFTAHRVSSLEPRIRAIVVEVLDRIAGQGSAEAVGEIAVPITVRVICDQLGLDPEEVGTDKIAAWSHATAAQLGRMQSREQMIENAHLMCEMQNYIIGCVRERENAPREDMISDLVHAQTDDAENPTLTFEEKVSSVKAILVAGNETTTSAFINILHVLATEPGLYANIADQVDDDRAMYRFVDEILRQQSPVHGLYRIALRDLELGGTRIPKGSPVMALFASANRDETQFPCPATFDTARSNLGRHVAFGAGIHRCIGASLARMEMKVFAQEVLRRLTDIRFAAPPEGIDYFPSLATYMMQHMPLTFTRRAGHTPA